MLASQLLDISAQKNNLRLYLDDRPVQPHEAFSPQFLTPVILKLADARMQAIMGMRFLAGGEVRQDPASLFGVHGDYVMEVQTGKVPPTLPALFIIDTAEMVLGTRFYADQAGDVGRVVELKELLDYFRESPEARKQKSPFGLIKP